MRKVMLRETRKNRLNTEVKTNSFACAAMSLHTDKNLHIILRNLACMAGKEFFVIGSDNWFKGATNGLENFVKVSHFKNESDFFDYIVETDYTLISVEQSDKSLLISDLDEYPENPLFIFGNESFGLGDNVLLNSELVVEIPNPGWHPCFNVGVSSGIVFYDYMIKNVKKQNLMEKICA